MSERREGEREKEREKGEEMEEKKGREGGRDFFQALIRGMEGARFSGFAYL